MKLERRSNSFEWRTISNEVYADFVQVGSMNLIYFYYMAQIIDTLLFHTHYSKLCNIFLMNLSPFSREFMVNAMDAEQLRESMRRSKRWAGDVRLELPPPHAKLGGTPVDSDDDEVRTQVPTHTHSRSIDNFNRYFLSRATTYVILWGTGCKVPRDSI